MSPTLGQRMGMSVRASVALAAWLLALGPFAADAPLPLVVVASLLALAVPAALLARRQPLLLAATGAVAAYLGTAGTDLSLPRLVVLLLLLVVLSGLLHQRRLVLLASLVVGCALLLVTWVLRKSGWPAEAAQLARLAAGLCAFATAGVSVMALRSWRWPTPRLFAVHVAGVALIVAAVVALGRVVKESPVPTLPAWHQDAAVLAGTDGGLARLAQDRELYRLLERLRAAGDGDATYVWIAGVLAENADAELLRSFCPPRVSHMGNLGALWRSTVATGEAGCDAVWRWPEAGALRLENSTEPMLQRLRGDLLMEAGLWKPAKDAYERAAGLGDPYARRDLARALLDRGRVDALPQDVRREPTVQLWLGQGTVNAESWQLWNRLLDFATCEPAARRGVRSIDTPGKTLNVFDTHIGRRALATRSRYALGFALQLPLTPRGQVPSRLSLWVKVLRGMRLYLQNQSDQVLIYSCDAQPQSANRFVEQLPAVACSGSWQELELQPATRLAGPLKQIVLRGDLRLARLRAQP